MGVIDYLDIPGTTGWLGLTACPGREPGLLRGDSALLTQELARFSALGATAVLTLVEQPELEMLGLPELGERVRAAGLEWRHLPIQDFHAPGPAFEAAWPRARLAMYRHLHAGAGVIVHCLAGLGRTGTVASRVLIEAGLAPEDALRRVRAARPGSVQSREQLGYILRLTG
ncbi:MAG TPA: protein-tyrosine phosphatase family protein [Gammaproteobacteria bacterium]|nr:protein-tyrosine phosphatase family protein [Gammaproteobacteria bacterium]